MPDRATPQLPQLPPLKPKPREPRVLALIAAIAVVGTVLGLGALVGLRGATPPGLDREWLGELVEHRSEVWTIPALVFNYIGGGWVAVALIPGIGLLVFLLRREWWRALYWALSIGISAGVVQLLKGLFGRARPTDILVTADPGSFPSGHTANAATMAVVLGILLWRRWVWVVGVVYVVAMAVSRTYLGAHWLSDTVGGALLGAGIAVLVWAVLAARLATRARRRAGSARRLTAEDDSVAP